MELDLISRTAEGFPPGMLVLHVEPRVEEHYRSLIDSHPHGVFLASTGGSIVHVNPALARLLSCAPEDLIGRHFTDLFERGEGREPGERDRNTLRCGHMDTPFEELCLLAGRGRTVRVRMIPVQEAGQVVGVQGVVQESPEGSPAACACPDAPPREARIEPPLRGSESLNRALRESEARFRHLMEQPLAGIYILRHDRLSYVNPLFTQIFGYPAEELIAGLHITDLLVDEDRPLMRSLIQRRLKGEPSQARQTLRGVRKNGERVELEVYGTRTEIDGEAAFIGILLDITARKRAEAALREREEQLRHAQKLEAVGRLAGGIAHDFNNLLMVIQGSVNLILMESASENRHRADLEEIVRATERAATLTRQLLAFGRKQVLRPKVTNLNTVVEDLHKMMRRVIGEDVELRTELCPSLSCVRVDPGQLEQVVLNLIVNSRDAMPGGGRLTIRTQNAELTAKDAERFPYRVVPGPYVRLSIEDTGHGMPDSVLDRVFEPFFTTKEQGKGSGLGLSTVYGIIKQSDGYVWASSRLGRGTTFEIYLRTVNEVAEVKLPSSAPVLPRGSGTVLLVEDEEPVRTVTRRLLEQAGYRVVESASGREAVRQFDQYRGAIDLLLTDVVMPQMGGRELSAHLRGRDPSLRVLYMSGYADDRSVRQGTATQGSDFIQKPFAPQVLLERVQAALVG